MLWSENQCLEYETNGFLNIPNVFSPVELEIIKSRLPAAYADDSPRRTVEQDGRTVRAVYGQHAVDPVFRTLTQHPRLLVPAQKLLQDDVYVHQFKINVKSAFTGDVWQWHQDYWRWRQEDGMPRPLAVNAAILLTDCTELNGPLLFFSGSHKEGTVEEPLCSAAGDDGWKTTPTAELKCSLEQQLTGIAARYSLTSVHGKAGSVILFHPNLIHGSAGNMTPYDRTILFISYNAVSNRLSPMEKPRPEFLASRDFTPLTAVAADALQARVNDTASRADAIEDKVRAYFKDTSIDSFYSRVWGGEDIHVGIYNNTADPIVEASRRTVEVMAAMLPEQPGKARVLDLGAGDGGPARYLAASKGYLVDCLNLSELHNERNRRVNAERGLDNRIRVFDGSFEDPFTFTNVTYDLVWSQDAFFHSTDHQRLFRDIDKVLKPGGHLVFTDIMQSENCPQNVVDALLERIQLRGLLTRLPSFELYREAARLVGWREVRILDLPQHAERHYGSVLREVESRHAELAPVCGEAYLASVRQGLARWVSMAREGHLNWGIMLFKKPAGAPGGN